MHYYKIIRNGEVVDAGELFLKWQKKNRVLVSCSPDEAQFIASHDGENIYRVQWLNPAPAEAGQRETVEAAMIDRQEYLDLRAVLDEGETVPAPDDVQMEPDAEPEIAPEQPEGEKPMTVAQMREKLAQQDATIQMLTDCILEMSEVVYSGM